MQGNNSHAANVAQILKSLDDEGLYAETYLVEDGTEIIVWRTEEEYDEDIDGSAAIRRFTIPE